MRTLFLDDGLVVAAAANFLFENFPFETSQAQITGPQSRMSDSIDANQLNTESIDRKRWK